MRDRIRLMQKEIEKQMQKELMNAPAEAESPRRGLLARPTGESSQSERKMSKQSPQMKLVADYIKQIRQNKEEILNAKRD